MKISASQFRDVITALCQRHHMLDYTDSMVARYWPAFSRLDEAGQQAFLEVVLGTSPTPPGSQASAPEDDSVITPNRDKSLE
jgi:hypothetical protein